MATALRIVVGLAAIPPFSGGCIDSASLRPPWVVASDWDDTIKSGGRGFAYGIRGVGQRVPGTYPGVTTMLQELTSEDQADKRFFQIWSANPFGRKKTSSCVPNLHRDPLTRHGSIFAGLAWVLARAIPQSLPGLRDLALQRSAKTLGAAKYRAFRRTSKEAGSSEVIFIGDSGQGDVEAGCRMLTDQRHGSKAWVLIHDLTREVAPGQEPIFTDKRIAIKKPFQCGDCGDCDLWRSERMLFFKTIPEASFLLAQQGFLSKSSLQEIVTATQRELDTCEFRCDQPVLERLRAQGRRSCPYKELIKEDLKKCQELIECPSFWSGDGSAGSQPSQPRVVAMEELCSSRHVMSVVRRGEQAQRRACRSELYKKSLEIKRKIE